jgi:hypothetical protein
MSTTTDLKETVEQIQKQQERDERARRERRRDRPARLLIKVGLWLGSIGAATAGVIVIVILADPELDALKITTNPALAVFILGGLLFGIGMWIRHNRIGRDDVEEELRREIRDARPADAVELGRLVALHEGTHSLIRDIAPRLIPAFLSAVTPVLRQLIRETAQGIIAPVVREEIEKAYAAGYLRGVRQRVDSPNGNGAPALRSVRPDETA